MSGHNFAGARPLVSLGIPEFVVEAREPLLCRTDPDAYFATGLRPAQARELCAGCEQVEPCLAYALVHPELVGVWGGLTRAERRAVLRRDSEGRGPPCWLVALGGAGGPWWCEAARAAVRLSGYRKSASTGIGERSTG